MGPMILGHCVGDFLLQNRWMALTKKAKGWRGLLACIAHCVLYTVAVCAVMRKWDWWWIITVFTSHFIPDRTGLADWYLKMMNGRNLRSFVQRNELYDPYVGIDCGFTTIIYVVTDATIHILIMYYALQLIPRLLLNMGLS